MVVQHLKPLLKFGPFFGTYECSLCYQAQNQILWVGRCRVFGLKDHPVLLLSFRDVDAPLSIQINKGEELKSPGLFSRGLHVLGSASASLKAVSDWSRPGLDRL